MLFNADCARAYMDKSDKIGFKVKEIPIDDRSHLFENTVNLLISW